MPRSGSFTGCCERGSRRPAPQPGNSFFMRPSASSSPARLLLPACCWAVPWLRAIYFSAGEAAPHAEARQYAERYRLEAERLNEVETRSRSQGDALADDMVRRISSFLKSYGEMRRGEEFVMHEVRARARERVRWIAGAAMLAMALIAAPGSGGLLQRARFFRRHRERAQLAPRPAEFDGRRD